MFVLNYKFNFDVFVYLKAFKMIKEKRFEILDLIFVLKIEILKIKRVGFVAKLINIIFIDR